MSSGGEVSDSRLLRKYKEGAAFGGGGGVSLYCAVPAEGTTLPRRRSEGIPAGGTTLSHASGCCCGRSDGRSVALLRFLPV